MHAYSLVPMCSIGLEKRAAVHTFSAGYSNAVIVLIKIILSWTTVVVHKYGRRGSGRGPPNNIIQKSAMIFLNDNKGVLVK